MLVDSMDRMIATQRLEAFVPLFRGAEFRKIEVDFCHPEGVCFGFGKGITDLVMFVSPRIHWKSLNILEYVPKY